MNDSTCNLHDIIVNLCKGRLVCKFAENNISTKLVFLCGVLSNISPSSGTDIIKFLLILLNNKNPSPKWKSIKFVAGAKRGDIKFGLKSADHRPHKFGPTIVSPTNLTLLPNTEVIKFSNLSKSPQMSMHIAGLEHVFRKFVFTLL